jgi:hypothetical protein
MKWLQRNKVYEKLLAIACARGRFGNDEMPRPAAALGREVQSSEADRFATNALPVVNAINASGVTSLAGIARALNNRGIRTARGGRWHVSTVANVLARSVN